MATEVLTQMADITRILERLKDGDKPCESELVRAVTP